MSIEDSIREIVKQVVAEEVSMQARAPRPLLSAEQVGVLLGGIDAQAVYRLRRENQLKAVRLSETRFKFHPDEVERFIREGGAKPLRLAESPRKVQPGGAQ